MCARELASEVAEGRFAAEVVEHISGRPNVIPDYLYRRCDPKPDVVGRLFSKSHARIGGRSGGEQLEDTNTAVGIRAVPRNRRVVGSRKGLHVDLNATSPIHSERFGQSVALLPLADASVTGVAARFKYELLQWLPTGRVWIGEAE